MRAPATNASYAHCLAPAICRFLYDDLMSIRDAFYNDKRVNVCACVWCHLLFNSQTHAATQVKSTLVPLLVYRSALNHRSIRLTWNQPTVEHLAKLRATQIVVSAHIYDFPVACENVLK